MPLTPADQALDRTALLLAADVHAGLISSSEVIEGLLATRIAVRVDAADLGAAPVQTAVVTLILHAAMNGIGVDLQFPDVPLAVPQPPLIGGGLRSALDAHLQSAFPWVHRGAAGRYDAVFVIGGSAVHEPTDVLITGDRGSVAVGPAAALGHPPPWKDSSPFTAIAAGIAAAAIRRASRRRAVDLGMPAPLFSPRSTTTFRLDLPGPPFRPLGLVPAVSTGAITHNLLYTALRVPGLTGAFRLFDPDLIEFSNFNRYPLVTSADVGQPKAIAAERYSNELLHISGIQVRYSGGEAAGADRIIVGADDIAVRWTAARDTARWLGVGATSHLFAQVSSHLPDSPCAGCVHPAEDDGDDVIPTISIVSGWAGLHLALELVRDASRPAVARVISSFALGLNGSHALSEHPPQPSPRCPLSCASSRLVA